MTFEQKPKHQVSIQVERNRQGAQWCMVCKKELRPDQVHMYLRSDPAAKFGAMCLDCSVDMMARAISTLDPQSLMMVVLDDP